MVALFRKNHLHFLILLSCFACGDIGAMTITFPAKAEAHPGCEINSAGGIDHNIINHANKNPPSTALSIACGEKVCPNSAPSIQHFSIRYN